MNSALENEDKINMQLVRPTMKYKEKSRHNFLKDIFNHCTKITTFKLK